MKGNRLFIVLAKVDLEILSFAKRSHFLLFWRYSNILFMSISLMMFAVCVKMNLDIVPDVLEMYMFLLPDIFIVERA